MNYIDLKNFRKYEQLFGDNGQAKIGHVNYVIKNTNESVANLQNQINNIGGGLEGTDFVYVPADGTPAENGQALYDTYTNLTPRVEGTGLIESFTFGVMQNGGTELYTFYNPNLSNGQTYTIVDANFAAFTLICIYDSNNGVLYVQSSTGTVPTSGYVAYDIYGDVYAETMVLMAPGNYQLPLDLVLSKGKVSLSSLTGFADCYFHGTKTINITTNNIRVRGINTQIAGLPILTTGQIYNSTIENCVGGNYSFSAGQGNTSQTYGIFKNCHGLNYSFGGDGAFAGSAYNCTAGSYSFGTDYFGYAEDCNSGANSFSYAGNFNGITKDCISQGTRSFCYPGVYNNFNMEGTITGCRSQEQSFGYYANLIGFVDNCVGLSESFGAQGQCSAKITQCIAYGGSSFGTNTQGYTIGGFFKDCIAYSALNPYINDYGTNCFNAVNVTATIINCTVGAESFASGVNRTFSGEAYNCIAGNLSFGGNGGFLPGRLYFCRLLGGTFPTVQLGGKTRYCIDGNNSFNNQG